MPVHGVVVTLSGVEGQREGAMAALGAEPRATLGQAVGAKLPLVLETSGVEEEEALWGWLKALPGVVFYDVVYVDFSDVDQVDVASLGRRRARVERAESRG